MTVETDKKIKVAVNRKQLMVLAKYLDDEQELELTTFQQLYIEILEERKEKVINEFEEAGTKLMENLMPEELYDSVEKKLSIDSFTDLSLESVWMKSVEKLFNA